MTIPEEITKTINKSDSGFLIETANFLEAQGWTVTISPYYLDSFTGKSREIDLLATKTADVLYGKRIGSATYNLIIECKDIRNNDSINNNAVFWFKDSAKYEKELSDFVQRHFSDDPKNWYQLKNLHYFGNPDVAFLFESADSGSKDRENSSVFKALTQALHSLIYFRADGYGKVHTTGHNVRHYLPVVIYRDASNAVYKVNGEQVEQVKDNFLLAMNYSYNHPKKETAVSEFFLVDVVRYDLLQGFLDKISNDLKNLKSYIQDKDDHQV